MSISVEVVFIIRDDMFLYIHGSLNTCHLHVEPLTQNSIVQQCLATA